MRKMTAPTLLLGALLFCMAIVFALPGSRFDQAANGAGQTTATHAARKQDFKSAAGERILEVVEASYQTTDQGIDSESIRVRNLSNRNITALGVVWTVKFTNGTKCLLMQIGDYRLHQDMVAAKGIRPFAPYEEKVIPRLTKESLDENQKIESVEVEVTFVEFEDGSGVRLDESEMYANVLAKRRGANIYKRWIESSYGDDPRNLARVIRILSGDELPDDRELGNGWVEQGASIYRQWLRNLLNDKGTNALQDQLHRQSQKRQ
ncbi:MAG TPA: hypothetical protein VF546_14860 [Pyrinomonadaceae bacterium]|jgi:hypothetical protein